MTDTTEHSYEGREIHSQKSITNDTWTVSPINNIPMSYLKFDRAIMTNLREALDKEVLRRNDRGAIMCTTLVGCNTRKYHGMLIVPDFNAGNPARLLLSSLDETVIQHGAEFNLAVHKYTGDHFSPNGHKYIREFSDDKSIKYIYRVGGVILSKEIILAADKNQLLVKYKLLEAHSDTTLRLRPFLAFRTVRELTHENPAIDWSYTKEDQGLSLCLYDGFPRLYMQLSKNDVTWNHQPLWYKNFFYDKEFIRGNPCTEDLPTPGYFEFGIKKGEEIIFSACDTAIDSASLKQCYMNAYEAAKPIETYVDCLKNAVTQCIFKPDDEHTYLIAGSPWFGPRMRDTLVSLTAASFGTGNPQLYDEVMATIIPALWSYLDEGKEDAIIKGISQPDSILWLVNCIQDYYRWEGTEKTLTKYGDTIKRAMNYIWENKIPMMEVRENTLLYAEPSELSEPITWMDNTIDGWPVVDRRGYIVEYNALWYNNLCFYRNIFDLKDPHLDDYIDRVSESFVRVFVNEHDYLFDYVADNKPTDWSVRPNQIFAAGLSYSPLSRKLQRTVLDIVTRELKTPKGLRTLSPKSPYYKGYLSGAINDRRYAYMQGGVWPWLIYYYLGAYLKLFRREGINFVDRMLIPFEEEARFHGISCVSEMYDGTPPYSGRGAISFLMSLTAILRIRTRIDEYLSQGTEDIFNLSLTSHHVSSPDHNKARSTDHEKQE